MLSRTALRSARLLSARRSASTVAEAAKSGIESAKAGVESAKAKAHAHSSGSDTPWIVGSLLVFVPTLFYVTAPSDKGHHVPKIVYPNSKNHGMSREPKVEPEEEETPAPAAEETPEAPAEEAAPEEKPNTLEAASVPDDHDASSKQHSDKDATTLKPEDDKLSNAAEAAAEGDSHDPKQGQAKHETAKEESS